MLSSPSSMGSGSDSLSEVVPGMGRMRGGVYFARNVAVEMFWERCDEDRDLADSGCGVYGGGGPRAVVVALRGRTVGGEEGVKRRKGRVGKDAAVAEEARLRAWVVLLGGCVRLRTVGDVALGTGTVEKDVLLDEW